MDMSAMIQAVSSVGFPIVVCAYTLVTMNKTVSTNTESVNKLCALVDKLADKLHSEKEVEVNDK